MCFDCRLRRRRPERIYGRVCARNRSITFVKNIIFQWRYCCRFPKGHNSIFMTAIFVHVGGKVSDGFRYLNQVCLAVTSAAYLVHT